MVIPKASAQDQKEQIAVIRWDEPLYSDEVLSIQGEVEDPIYLPVIVYVVGRGKEGQPVVVDSGITQLEKRDENAATYRFDTQVPRAPGDYEVEVRLGESWIGRATIHVKERKS